MPIFHFRIGMFALLQGYIHLSLHILVDDSDAFIFRLFELEFVGEAWL
jgi:hypothetical protein